MKSGKSEEKSAKLYYIYRTSDIMSCQSQRYIRAVTFNNNKPFY